MRIFIFIFLLIFATHLPTLTRSQTGLTASEYEEYLENLERCSRNSGRGYCGEKIDGLAHGSGKYIYNDGSRVEGNWTNNKLSGNAVYYKNNGKIFNETWLNGKLVSRKEWSKSEYRKKEKAEEKARLAEKQKSRIYNNCIIDKLPADANGILTKAVRSSCNDISRNPSFFDKLKYD